ncbi:MAG: DUF4383 domain-containing protein [Archangium sp.]
MPVNITVTRVFSVVLVFVGVLGFVLPPSMAMTSGAPAYNVFHLFFGVIGFACAASKKVQLARAFNVGFGVIDLLQAVASFQHFWPEELFRWTRVDDVLHVVIGAALVAIGVLADRPRAVPAA